MPVRYGFKRWVDENVGRGAQPAKVKKFFDARGASLCRETWRQFLKDAPLRPDLEVWGRICDAAGVPFSTFIEIEPGELRPQPPATPPKPPGKQKKQASEPRSAPPDPFSFLRRPLRWLGPSRSCASSWPSAPASRSPNKVGSCSTATGQGSTSRAPARGAENEVVCFREVCRLVQEVDLTLLSVDALEQATLRPAPSPTAKKRRRVVLARILRLLEADGLPARAERRAGKRIEAALLAAEPEHRPPVQAWLDARRRRVSLHELSYEARRIVQLEGIAAAAPASATDEDLIHEWLRTIVQQVLACKCPPVTRALDPEHCTSSSCNATVATAGTRPSPAPRKQRELESIGRRYLQQRRAPEGGAR